MKRKMRIIVLLSILLFICGLIGQVNWLYKVRELEINRFRQAASSILIDSFDEYLNKESLDRKERFSYGVKEDGKTFIYGNDSIIEEMILPSVERYQEVGNAVFYDYLYKNRRLNVFKLDSLYRENLRNEGIDELFCITLCDSAGQNLISAGIGGGEILTQPVYAGYEVRHQIIAAFRIPFIFRSMIQHLVWEGIFLFAFIGCLVWLWKMIRQTWQSANVQTMGMAHLEHELKKPLAALALALGGIVNRKNRELTEIQEQKLRMIEVRVRKMAEITDTMLVALKTTRLKVDRVPVDVAQEIESVAEMFRILRPYARLEFQVEDAIGRPLLDKVYFNNLLINLVDNAIKYGGDEPWVNVGFRREDEDWVLTVTDHGIGMSAKVLKRIFRRFYRVKDKKGIGKTGFGLGLAFVRKVVDAYGGKILVESIPGKGSKFEIRIKIA